MANSVYIHIPFCRQKCKYCSFISFNKLEQKQQYLNALQREISRYYKGELLNTLYFGGGTPSLLTPDEFQYLIEPFNINDNTEITVEINPENITIEYLKSLKKLKINRLSIGCQTFNDNILAFIGRKHNSQQVELVVNLAQQAGFENISLDFIYGLPYQTIYMFENDLKKALSLKIQHISLYGLKIDENCYFSKHLPENLPNDDIQADMYLRAIEILKNFNHYEISNFGKPSKHNLNYWDNENYYGFGVAAHGYIENTRYENETSLEKYIQNPLVRKSEQILSTQEQLEEEIFLGFRKMSGINVQKINEKFEINFEEKFKKVLAKYNKFFTKTDNGYALNIEGILISNSILCEFLEC